MTQGIKDKVVVITGASSGLGEATARHLAKHGAKLVLGARRIERLQALAGELSLGNQAVVQTDVTNQAQVRRLVDRAVETHGRIDVMLNNAGLMPVSPLERLKIDDWDRMIDVNIKGVLYGIAAALPHMQAQKHGHIINVSSVAGHKVSRGIAVYSATKAAVRVISEGLRQEVKPYNIRHNHHLTRPGRERATRQHHRARHRRELSRGLRGRRSGRCLREDRRIRHQPAGRRGYQRDPVQTHHPRILNARSNEAGPFGSPGRRPQRRTRLRRDPARTRGGSIDHLIRQTGRLRSHS